MRLICLYMVRLKNRYRIKWEECVSDQTVKGMGYKKNLAKKYLADLVEDPNRASDRETFCYFLLWNILKVFADQAEMIPAAQSPNKTLCIEPYTSNPPLVHI